MGAPTSSEIQERALRDGANALLAQLPDKGRALFHRIHDGAPWKGWENCPVENGTRRPLAESYDLLARSVPTTQGEKTNG